jgi:Xaa-Pro aminopeptidase
MRIESALIVTRVKTKGEFNGDIWLGFERLTCVPIQTRMVKESMLTKEEKAWIKVRTTFFFPGSCDQSIHLCSCTQDHNQRCRERLEPFLRDKDDKRALKWIKRESERGIGIVGLGPGGICIDWD